MTLWCRVDNKCVTRLEAAAEGTLCGSNEVSHLDVTYNLCRRNSGIGFVFDELFLLWILLPAKRLTYGVHFSWVFYVSLCFVFLCMYLCHCVPCAFNFN